MADRQTFFHKMRDFEPPKTRPCVIPHIAATMNRVHTYGLTVQISFTLTRMARNVFVQLRFCVFFLYQINKLAYLMVIILVEPTPLFAVSLMCQNQSINCLLLNVKLLIIISICILAPVSVGALLP